MKIALSKNFFPVCIKEVSKETFFYIISSVPIMKCYINPDLLTIKILRFQPGKCLP